MARLVTRTPKTRTDAERLGWALWFAQADLTKWRDGDWLNALEDVEDMALGAAPPTFWATPVKGSSPERVKAQLQPLQGALKGFFERIDQARQRARDSRRAEREPIHGGPPRLRFSGWAAFSVDSTGRRLRVQFQPQGESLAKLLATGIILRVADLLTRVDLRRLKRCPECHRLFLAVRRQRFDTPRCSLRDRKRRFLAKRRPGRVRR